MSQAIEYKIHNRIRGKGRSWVFSDRDFRDIASCDAVRQVLSRLTKKDRIRRIIPGLYDYPPFSDVLKQQLSPDIHQAAQALARKFGWRIQPSGNTALNVLGLSTQIPAKAVYFSDGPARSYQIGNRKILFQKTALKYASLNLPDSALVVQALSALGKEKIDDGIVQKIREKIPVSKRKRILKDTRVVNSWVYEFIRSICLP